MTLNDFQAYCHGMPASERTQIGHSVYFKIKDKVFAILDDQLGHEKLTIKCDMQKALELRERYKYIHPGYHINKEHWNTIFMEDINEAGLVMQWIDESYELVKNSLSKKQLASIGL
jgi:predicted DNA-binding protein (MmcQ/YjbR family)